MIESDKRIRQLPYQRKKLVLLLSAMRHYADTLRGQGYRVEYHHADTFAAGLRQHAAAWQPERILCMAANEYEARRWQVEELASQIGVPVEVLPNVIGMGLNADGGQTATKPYLASAHNINRMSDYCRACRYDPKRRSGPDACPYNALYWSFLIEHEAMLHANPRLGPAVLGLARIGGAERRAIREQAARFLERLPYYAR